MSIRVSVIVPVYNVEEYIEKCIDSILSQTYNNYELILLNDGSTDRTFSILLKYESNPCVTIVNKKNTGQADTRYQGLLMASGDYIYFVDSDDFIESDTLEKLVKIVEERDADVVFGRYRLVDEQYNILREQKKYSVDILSDTINIVRDAILVNNFKASLWLKLIRKSILVESYVAEIRDIHLNEDIFLSILIALHCRNVSFIDDVIYNVLQRSNSITRNLKPELITENEKIFYYLSIYLKKSGLWELCSQEYYNGYIKTILYALSVAAIRSSSFFEYLSFYNLLRKDSLYYGLKVHNKTSVLSIINRLMFLLSRFPRIFYLTIKMFKSILRY